MQKTKKQPKGTKPSATTQKKLSKASSTKQVKSVPSSQPTKANKSRRVRKPLTEEQRARKNALERARRASLRGAKSTESTKSTKSTKSSQPKAKINARVTDVADAKFKHDCSACSDCKCHTSQPSVEELCDVFVDLLEAIVADCKPTADETTDAHSPSRLPSEFTQCSTDSATAQHVCKCVGDGRCSNSHCDSNDGSKSVTHTIVVPDGVLKITMVDRGVRKVRNTRNTRATSVFDVVSEIVANNLAAIGFDLV